MRGRRGAEGDAWAIRAGRRLVAAALLLYPPRFRRRFGAEMSVAFGERLREAAARGRMAAAGAVVATLVDVVASAVREWSRPSLRRGAGHDASGRRGPGPMLDVLGQDIRFALRSLLKRPGFTAAAGTTLAVGIGANTAIFSVVYAVLFTPLPYPEPDRIVTVWSAEERSPADRSNMSMPDLRDLEATAGFERIVGYSAEDEALTGTGEAEIVRAAHVTGGVLAVFGLSPRLGRDIRTEDAVPGGPAVVMVSHGFWRSRLGGGVDVAGRTLELQGRTYEVVGVAPEGFGFPNGADLWVPYPISEGCARSCHVVRAIGRLSSGITLETARLQSDALAQRLQDEFPDSNFEKVFNIVPLGDDLVADVRTGLWILAGAVGLVLLIVCANVANLLLVRAQTRVGEVAVRAALGASRLRLGGQVMVESLVLAVLGGAAGLALSFAGVKAIRVLAPSDVPRLDLVAVNGPVLAFASTLVLLVAVLFGAIPALRLAGVPPGGDLRAAGRGGRTRMEARSRNLMLMGEVAISLVLLVGAGLLLKSFGRLVDIDPGYETRAVVRFTLALPATGHDDLEALAGFVDRLESRIRATPDVESVGSAYGAPLASGGVVVDVTVDGRPEPPPGEGTVAALRPATAGYFETLGIPLLEGRGLLDSDGPGSRPVAVVSRRFVQENFPDEDPIGRRIHLAADFGYGSPMAEVVGVVSDVRSESLQADARAAVYVPLAQRGPRLITVHVRGRPGAAPLLPVLRTAVRELNPDLPLRSVESMDEAVSRQLAPSRFHLILIGGFALAAVGLAALGLFGVVAYIVSERTHEVGIRMALGARGEDVVRLIVAEGARPAAWGIAIGLIAALAGGRVIEGLLFEVEPRDPVIIGGVIAILATVVLLASALPARRATRVPASRVLRD